VVRVEVEKVWSLLSFLLFADIFASLAVLRLASGLISRAISPGNGPLFDIAGVRPLRGRDDWGVGWDDTACCACCGISEIVGKVSPKSTSFT
jgi:hypothetical protein